MRNSPHPQRPARDTRPLRRLHLACAGSLAALLLAGCTSLPAWLGDDDAASVSSGPADRVAHEASQVRLHAAVQAAQPGQAQLSRARRALEALLADDSTEARAHHPYARALLEQIRERQRLAGENERLVRELDATRAERSRQAAALEQSRRDAATLQQKLDALTDIERKLSPPADTERAQ